MYRKSMRSALEEARAYSAVNEVKVSKGGKTLSISKRDVGVYQAKGWSLQEANMKRILQALQDKLSDEGGAAGFDDLKKTAKSMGLDLTPAMLKDMPGIKQHRDGDYILEETITEFKKMVVTIADPMKRAKAMDDIKRFGKSTGFRIDKMSDGKSFRIDGQGADLNKFAIDMKNFYGAEIKAESVEELEEQKRYMLTYGKKGEKVKAFYSDDHSDVQKKASELRGKGFVVDKMGLTQPMSKLRDRIPEQVEEETELVEFTLADYRELESDNQHDIAAKKLIDKFGTPQEKSTINDINRRHAKTGYISGVDFRLRTTIVNRYYSRLK